MKKIAFHLGAALVLCASAASLPLAQASTLTQGFTLAGATDLRPLSVSQVNGQMHLQFTDATAAKLPMVYALGDDGKRALVDFTVHGAEYVVGHPVSTLIVQSGDREAIVQQAAPCSLNGVKVEGKAKISCAG